MGYIKATGKQTTKTMSSITIRIGYKTLLMMRDLFPGIKNESAASYFYRLAGELKRLKELERGVQ